MSGIICLNICFIVFYISDTKISILINFLKKCITQHVSGEGGGLRVGGGRLHNRYYFYFPVKYFFYT